jgi:sugar/nucleoside kinase (ribokinase family)
LADRQRAERQPAERQPAERQPADRPLADRPLAERPLAERRRIVVFGDVIDDVVVVPSGAIRGDTDTPASIRNRAGGSAANVAAWIGSLGGAVDFVGVVGADDIARHTALFESAGVTAHLEADPTRPTGSIVIIVEGERRTMLSDSGANSGLSPDAVTDGMLAGAALLHFTGYSVFSQSDQTSLRQLIARASLLGVAVSVDPASAGYLNDFGTENFLAAVAGARLFFPNLEEGRLLTGLADPVAVAEGLAERFQIVALTLGTAGVVVAERGQPTRSFRAIPVEITDPTGAGDAFAAGFLSALAAGAGVPAAAEAGVRAASVAVVTFGGRPPA